MNLPPPVLPPRAATAARAAAHPSAPGTPPEKPAATRGCEGIAKNAPCEENGTNAVSARTQGPPSASTLDARDFFRLCVVRRRRGPVDGQPHPEPRVARLGFKFNFAAMPV